MAIEDGDVIGALPLILITHPLFSDKLVSMPFLEYGGIVTDGSNREDAKSELLKQAQKIAIRNDVDYLSIRGQQIDNDQEFQAQTPYVTFELNLGRGCEDIWDGFESRFRRAVRKARKNELEVEQVTDENGLRRFYDLYNLTMTGHGTPPHSYDYFDQMLELVDSVGTVDITLATYKSKDVNGMVTLRYGGRSLYALAGSDYEYREKNGGSLLLWDSIQTAIEHGDRVFDLGRTREGSGVYRYKTGLNGNQKVLPVSYFYPGEKISPPRLEDSKYQIATEIWRHLPSKLTRSIGPYFRKYFP